MAKVLFCRKVGFRAQHHYQLPGLSEAENQARFGESALPHEHDWRLTLWLEGPVDPLTGMMIDLVKVDQILEKTVVAVFDGRHINQADPFFKNHQPTNEVLAGYFAEKLQPQLKPVAIAKLRIAESDDIFAEWRP